MQPAEASPQTKAAEEIFDQDAEVERLERLFAQQYGRMLAAMHALVLQKWGPEVEDFRLDDAATRRVLQYAGSRVVRITETTRAAIAEQLAIGQGLGLSTWEIANGQPKIGYRGIEGLFTETWRGRPDMVARTELQEAQRVSALDRYYATGLVDRVKLIDGDDWDPPCRDRNGKVVPIQEAPGLAHPNCTLVLVPVLKDDLGPDAKPQAPERKWGDWRTLQEAQADAEKRFPHIAFDFGGAHIDTIKPTLVQFAMLADDYPLVAERLRYIGTYSNPAIRPYSRHDPSATWGNNTFAHATRDGEEIGINPAFYGDPERMRKSVASGTVPNYNGKPWHPYGTEPIESVMTHEFGHHVENWLGSVPSGIAANPYVSRMSGYGLVREEFSRWRYTHKATSTLSKYAAKSEEEGFAEAFAAQYHSPASVRNLKYVKTQKKMLDAIGDPSKWRHSQQVSDDLAEATELLKLYPEAGPNRTALLNRISEAEAIIKQAPGGTWRNVTDLPDDERSAAREALEKWRLAFW